MPSFVEIGQPVPEKIFEGFLPLYGLGGNLGHVTYLCILSFYLFIEASHLGFWSGNLFLIAPFPDLCLLVPFSYKIWLWLTERF